MKRFYARPRGRVCLEQRIMINTVRGNAAADLRRRTANADPDWLAGSLVATDLAQSVRAGLSPHLDHATRVAEPFHRLRRASAFRDEVPRNGSQQCPHLADAVGVVCLVEQF
jgi:hypothetical protein